MALVTAKEIAAATAAIDAAYGTARPFSIQGEVTTRSARQVSLRGRALPVGSMSSGVLGAHWNEAACLVVENPEDIGRFAYDRYFADAAYYVGEAKGMNAFGAVISCSRYGPISQELRRRLAPLEQSLDQARERFVQATVPERQEVRRLEQLLGEVRATRSRLEGEHRAAQREVVENPHVAGDRLGEAYRALGLLYPRQQALERRIAAVQQYLADLEGGVRRGSLEALVADFDRQDAAEISARSDKAKALLAKRIEEKQADLRRLEAQLANDEKIFAENQRIAAQYGSDTSRSAAAYNEARQRLLALIEEAEVALRQLRAEQ